MILQCIQDSSGWVDDDFEPKNQGLCSTKNGCSPQCTKQTQAVSGMEVWCLLIYRCVSVPIEIQIHVLWTCR